MTSLSAGAPRVDEAFARPRALAIDQAELRETVEHLAGFGSSPLGFRTTGTPEDRAAAEYAAEQFRAIGLEDVAIEEVRVDGWRFEGACLEAGEHRFEASSMGGVPAVDGLEARLVDARAAAPPRPRPPRPNRGDPPPRRPPAA